MSPYDDAKYVTPFVYPMPKATFAAAITTATNRTATSANVGDRVEFFKNIKITAVRANVEVEPDDGAHATSNVTYQVTDGTTAFASITYGSGAAGANTAGTVLSANVAANKGLYIDCILTQDGTAVTHSPGSLLVDLEYQLRR
jgi:hypothetical protein